MVGGANSLNTPPCSVYAPGVLGRAVYICSIYTMQYTLYNRYMYTMYFIGGLVYV